MGNTNYIECNIGRFSFGFQWGRPEKFKIDRMPLVFNINFLWFYFYKYRDLLEE